jgi:hypothetical protein
MSTPTGTGAHRRGEGGAPERSPAEAHPTLAGDLDEVLTQGPVFRTRLNGYDRLEVDNYAAWAEGELAAARKEIDHLLSRYGAASAELEISRRVIAETPRGRDVFPISDRVQEMLRLASEEAAALTDAGAEEADRLVAEARTEADARLRKAREIKQMAVAAADELREHARQDRAAAAAELDRARSEAEQILRAAAVERDRLAEEAAQERQRADRAAKAHLLAVQEQVSALWRRRDEARESLRRLTDGIGQALQAVVGTLPEAQPVPDGGTGPNLRALPDVRMVDNFVADDQGSADRQGADRASGEGSADDRVALTGRP